MRLQVNKNNEIMVVGDTEDILYYSVKNNIRSGKPTVYAVMAEQERIAIAERENVAECMKEIDEILNAKDLSNENKMQNLAVTVAYTIVKTEAKNDAKRKTENKSIKEQPPKADKKVA